MRYVLSDFDFNLPEHLIAQTPATPRDAAKLLVFNRQTGEITDTIFKDIGLYLPINSSLVLNNTKVDKCRLRFGNLEIFILETVNDRTVRALVKPGPKFKLGQLVRLTEDIEAKVVAIDEEGVRTLQFNCRLDDQSLDIFRLTPLPPYIRQNEQLAEQYQTVYAHHPGSKAAPTAGLHFTPELLDALKKDHPLVEITLNVGLGTFAPIKSPDLDAIHLHHETYAISAHAAKTLNQSTYITAVGTTSVRTLESAVTPDSKFTATSASTNIFIQPGYTFKAVDALVTNFHLPKTSLLMLVGAFMGVEQMMACYNHAINNKYRFYSFGDAMLIV